MYINMKVFVIIIFINSKSKQCTLDLDAFILFLEKETKQRLTD